VTIQCRSQLTPKTTKSTNPRQPQTVKNKLRTQKNCPIQIAAAAVDNKIERINGAAHNRPAMPLSARHSLGKHSRTTGRINHSHERPRCHTRLSTTLRYGQWPAAESPKPTKSYNVRAYEDRLNAQQPKQSLQNNQLANEPQSIGLDSHRNMSSEVVAINRGIAGPMNDIITRIPASPKPLVY